MIQDIISLSIWLVYIVPITLFLYTQNPIHVVALIGPVIAQLSELIKYKIGKRSSRPDGALDCNLMCNDGDKSGQPGMPSGHSIDVSFFTGFYWQYTDNIIIRSALILYAALVMLSRYLKKCHTVGQITAGAMIGLGASFIIGHVFLKSAVFTSA